MCLNIIKIKIDNHRFVSIEDHVVIGRPMRGVFNSGDY